MELRKKWKSRSGASILIALLFFLVSIMVSSSILMAAVSNAGKLNRNRLAQQRYLALSSAIQMICDELVKAEYCGKYRYEEIITYKEETEEGEGGGQMQVEAVEYHYTQTQGEYCCGLEEVLPLLEDLDLLFARTFPPDKEWEEENGDQSILVKTTYEALADLPSKPHGETDPHTMTLTVNTQKGEEGNLIPGLMEEVHMEIWLSHISENGYTLRLRASMGEEDANGHVFKMEAELTQTGTAPVLSDNPGEGGQEYTAGPMTWALGWIAKEEAEDNEG